MTTRSEALARARGIAQVVARNAQFDSNSGLAISQLIEAIRALADAIGAEEEQPEPASEWRRETTMLTYTIRMADKRCQVSYFSDYNLPWKATKPDEEWQAFDTEAEALAWLGVPAETVKGWTA